MSHSHTNISRVLPGSKQTQVGLLALCFSVKDVYMTWRSTTSVMHM